MKKFIILIVPVIVLVYSRSLPIYFSGDDWVFLYNALRGLDIPHIFKFSPGSFAPIVNLSFLILYKLFHLNHVYYHIVVLSIHIINCILLFRIIAEMSRDRRLAFLTALVFSVFSPYNQIVIWIDGLPGLITSFFFLSSFYGFVMYRKAWKKIYYLFSLLSFISAIFSKEWAITLFALFIFYDALFYRKTSGKILSRPVTVYLPFVIILTIYLSAELLLPYSDKKDMIGPHIFSNLSTYLNTFIIPSQNVSEFPIKAFIPLLDRIIPFLIKFFSITLPLLSLIGIIRGSNFIKFFILWIYITLLPFLFFNWGTASRYYYLPSIGVISILMYFFIYMDKSFKNRPSKIILRLCLCLFIIIHISFIELRITKLYCQNRKIQDILTELKDIHLEFPLNSHLFFSGFPYDRKWSYAVRTVYREPSLIVYRSLPTPEDLKEKSSPVFIFEYKDGQLHDLSKK